MKERLVGAAVLLMLAVIFIPMILTGTPDQAPITESNIPRSPKAQFKSRVIPLDPVLPSPSIDRVDDSLAQKDTATLAPPQLNEVTEDSPPQRRTTVVKQSEESPAAIPAQSNLPVSQAEQSETDNLAPTGWSAWVVQLGSFSEKENAETLSQKLRKMGYPAFVEPITQGSKHIYRVRVGPELFRSDADTLLETLKTDMQLEGIVLYYP